MATTKVIPTTELGKTGVKLGRIGLGCMMMSWATSNPPPREQSFQVLERAIQLGCNFWNTGEFYGDNEALLNEFLSKHPGQREKLFISVKAGLQNMAPNGDPAFIKENIETNIKNLGFTYLDLYQCARVDPKVPIEVTIGAIAEKVKEGKVRFIGLSECSVDTLRRACKVHPIAAVEIEYSPWVLDPETNGMLEACKELGVGIIAYSPLGRGFLTGTIKKPEDLDPKDFRSHLPRFQGENFQKNIELVNEFEKVAKKKNVTPSQLCLAWILSRSPLVIPIPGTTKAERLESNLVAADITLTEDEKKDIQKVLDSCEVVGGRYPPQHSALLNGSSKPLDQ